MKIIIDISSLNPLALKRGVGNYYFHLIKALALLKDNNSYLLRERKNQNFKEAGLIHFPFFDPFFPTLPVFTKKPFVITIHDLIPLIFPKHYPVGIKGKLIWQRQKFLVKKAKAVITDSQKSKEDIIKILNYRQDRIFPIYLAADKEFRKIKIKKKDIRELEKKYHLPQKFLLYVGDINWNKNLTGLIRAFFEFRKYNKKIKLVLIGEAFKNKNLAESRHIDNLIFKLGLSSSVFRLGYLPLRDLIKIYNLALFYIQPSFYEGFGLPVLEAISCGCPVICSNQASIPEIAGNAALYFNPYSKTDLFKKLLFLSKNRNKRRILSHIGLKQAKKFSWEKTALQTREVYEKILAEV